MKYKIYKLTDNTNGNIYIGITIQKLSQRLNNHKQDYKRDYYCVSKKIIANGDYKIELIEETDDKTRERYWIENSVCVNQIIPYRSKEEKKEYNDSWNKNNKQYFKEYTIFRNTWGGDVRYENNLLKIDPNLFL